MRVHGAAAMVTLVLTGGVVALHTPSGWRERKNRFSGLAVSVALIAIAATGCGLYYFGGESARMTASLSHWILGLILPAVMALHVWFGRRARVSDGQ
jgi:hypothetical protein